MSGFQADMPDGRTARIGGFRGSEITHALGIRATRASIAMDMGCRTGSLAGPFVRHGKKGRFDNVREEH